MTVIRSGMPPSRDATTSTTCRTITAASSWAANARPPIDTGVGSPMRRLNSRATRSGSTMARRSAASPTSKDPSGRRNTTDGWSSEWSPRDTISGATWPTRWIAAAVLVVPTSIPSR